MNNNRFFCSVIFWRNGFLSAVLMLLFATANAAEPAAAPIDPTATEDWSTVPVVVSPGAGGGPPSDAIVLFDGSDLAAWETGVGASDTYAELSEFLHKLQQPGDPVEWDIKKGNLIVKPGSGYIKTKRAFADVQLHVEWKSPEKPLKEGQNRGNSGIFLQGLYEVQILDSYQHQTYSNGQAGAVYKQTSPLVNASLPPGQWQTYDIVFTAPVFGRGGKLISSARVTVIHNGVLVQNNVSIWGPTTYRGIPVYRAHPTGLPLVLQDHSELVSFRNIWIREL